MLTTFGFDAEGQLVHVKDTQKGELYTCPQCGDRIIARNSGIAIEKAYQDGGAQVRAAGLRVESLARIASMSVEDGVKFVGEE